MRSSFRKRTASLPKGRSTHPSAPHPGTVATRPRREPPRQPPLPPPAPPPAGRPHPTAPPCAPPVPGHRAPDSHGDLQHTAGIAHGDIVDPFGDVRHLPFQQSTGHLRMGQIVHPCAAATAIGIRHLHQGEAGNALQQLPRLLSDPLSVGQMACLVIGDGSVHASGRRVISDLLQEGAPHPAPYRLSGRPFPGIPDPRPADPRIPAWPIRIRRRSRSPGPPRHREKRRCFAGPTPWPSRDPRHAPEGPRQHRCLSGITTSHPLRVSTRTVASLIPPYTTSITQPVSRATRYRRSPWGRGHLQQLFARGHLGCPATPLPCRADGRGKGRSPSFRKAVRRPER